MMLIITLATGCNFDFGVLVLISSSKIWTYVNWTSQILPNLAFESLTTDFELLKHSYFISKSIMYFDGVAQLVFLSLFPCLYTNKRESLDRSERGVCCFRNVCNASRHISGHHAFSIYCSGKCISINPLNE